MTDKTSKERHAEQARKMWAAMDDNERHGVSFGLFPQRIMDDAVGYNQHNLCVLLMAMNIDNMVTGMGKK